MSTFIENKLTTGLPVEVNGLNNTFKYYYYIQRADKILTHNTLSNNHLDLDKRNNLIDF